MSPVGEAQADRKPVLAARELSQSYGEYVALESITLEVRAGEAVALIGGNGAGKTTFLSVAAGLLEPSAGLLEVAGSPAGSIAARKAASYLPDTPVFYDDLSLNEHLDYIAALHGVTEGSRRSADRLRRFGLQAWGDSLPSEFSRGMRQKASIALALVRPHSVLLADEPFDGLDAASRPILFQLLRQSCDDGAAVVMATHDPEVVAAADRCVELQDGRLAHTGVPMQGSQ
jgi:ABC-2 type transport system ATP-binding protein